MISNVELDKTLDTPVQPWLIKLCPSMDIVAFATSEHSVEVCRFNGQQVFQYHGSEESVISSLAWQSAGK